MQDHADSNASAIPGRETFPPAGERGIASSPRLPLGTRLLDNNRCEVRVWAPGHERVAVHIVAPVERRVFLDKMPDGYHESIVDDCGEGTRYLFDLGRTERPDPASRSQPDGVHAASEVIGTEFEWHDEGWAGIALEDSVIYELHVGTFTNEGTFDAVIPHLDGLKDLGVTTIELLPIAQFPGARNWGYDGTYIGAAQSTYGGPRALKRLVDACHQRGLAIFLDVVYNHLGPEGNYLSEYGPYFTDRYRTPWGLALNFGGPHSDHVRWFFIHNALQWLHEFHFDGLRVDAVHAIVDHSAEPFLQDLNAAIHALPRKRLSIAESDLNDPRVLQPREAYGLGFDSQWADDYHHTLHALLTGEQDGYYESFPPRVSLLGQVLKKGYLYIGQHSPYRGRKYGADPKTRNGACFVVSSQNHDQVGNRMLGERLTTLVSPAQVRLVAAAILLSPFVPMLFMGEEYGETAPFQYFTSHGDPDLIEAVRKGRLEEFDDFDWSGEPPDPHSEETFQRSKLTRVEDGSMRALYKELLRMRREIPALRTLDLASIETEADDEHRVLLVRRWTDSDEVRIAFNFSDEERVVDGVRVGAWGFEVRVIPASLSPATRARL